MNGYLKAATPHIIAVVMFLLVAGIYFAPALSGKVFRQSDNIQAIGMQKEINDIRSTGKAHPLWTNSMFGGMPVFQIHMPAGNNFTRYFNKVFLLGGKITSPHMSTFLMMAMFYILMVAMGVDWRVGIIGSIAYGMATNHIVLNEAGHTTKLITMAYLPPTLAGIILIFRGKYLAGGILAALFLSLQILANHVQISYYFFLAVFFLGVLEGVRALRENQLPQFGKAVGVLLLVAVLGVGANIARLWTTYEYTDETIRGKSEITIDGQYSQGSSSQNKVGEGLSKDYIFGWSYGVSETWTVLIPDFMGRKSGSFVNDKESNSYKAWLTEVQKLQQAGGNNQSVNQQAQQLAQVANTYRGDVTFTSGPIYWGAIICFLFILGLITVKGPMKWWLLIATVMMVMFAWGRHFPAFNFFLYEHFPMFNKFRAVMMALGVAQLFVTLLAILSIKELVESDEESSKKAKNVLIAGGITAGLSLLIYLASMMGFIDFTSPRDNKAVLDAMPNFANAIYADRAGMLQADALRSFLFVALAASALWAYAAGKIKWVYALPVLGVLVLLDFWLVDQRFVDANNFQTPQESRQVEQPRPADQQVLNDTDPHFRVLDMSRGANPFQDGRPSYFHKSLGGYHAAKLMRFQDLCEHYLFSLNPGDQTFQFITGMFNTKWFILNNNGQDYAIQNPGAAGASWFVKEYAFVENPDEELKALAGLDIRQKAVVEKKYAKYLDGLTQDSTITAGDNITLTSYQPDKMVYNVKASKDRLAMFGEIYYPPSKGWNVYIDGKKLDPSFIKANYAIRAVRVPAGEYQLEMRFEPNSYKTGSMIGLICSFLIIGGLGFFLYTFFKNFDASKYVTEKPVKEERPSERKTAPRKTSNTRKEQPKRKPPKRRKK